MPLCFLSSFWGNMTWQRQLKEERAYPGSQLQVTLHRGGEVWQHEPGTAGHTKAVIKKSKKRWALAFRPFPRLCSSQGPRPQEPCGCLPLGSPDRCSSSQRICVSGHTPLGRGFRCRGDWKIESQGVGCLPWVFAHIGRAESSAAVMQPWFSTIIRVSPK